MFPFNWFPQRVGTTDAVFHGGSIATRFPFNWFPQRVGTLHQDHKLVYLYVSIQLVSPASGDFKFLQMLWLQRLVLVSIQLVSPASGDTIAALDIAKPGYVSIQLVSPASGDNTSC